MTYQYISWHNFAYFKSFPRTSPITQTFISINSLNKYDYIVYLSLYNWVCTNTAWCNVRKTWFKFSPHIILNDIINNIMLSITSIIKHHNKHTPTHIPNSYYINLLYTSYAPTVAFILGPNFEWLEIYAYKIRVTKPDYIENNHHKIN